MGCTFGALLKFPVDDREYRPQLGREEIPKVRSQLLINPSPFIDKLSQSTSNSIRNSKTNARAIMTKFWNPLLNWYSMHIKLPSYAFMVVIRHFQAALCMKLVRILAKVTEVIISMIVFIFFYNFGVYHKEISLGSML